MKHPKSIRISIPTPCHEDWSKMTLQEQGRFCNSCHKCVVDFTGFTDEQLYNYLLAHKNERICGRVYTSQTNRAIQLPAQPQSTLYKWVIAAGLVLLSTAAPESKTFAQAPLMEQSMIKPTQKDTNTTTNNTTTINGVITNNDKELIFGATINILSKNSTAAYDTAYSFDGKFRINIPNGEYRLIVSHPDFIESELIINTVKDISPLILELDYMPIFLGDLSLSESHY